MSPSRPKSGAGVIFRCRCVRGESGVLKSFLSLLVDSLDTLPVMVGNIPDIGPYHGYTLGYGPSMFWCGLHANIFLLSSFVNQEWRSRTVCLHLSFCSLVEITACYIEGEMQIVRGKTFCVCGWACNKECQNCASQQWGKRVFHASSYCMMYYEPVRRCHFCPFVLCNITNIANMACKVEYMRSETECPSRR